MKKINSKKYDLLKTITITLMLLFIVDYYVFSLAVVEGESMYPTINSSDRLIYVKLPYFRNRSKRGDIVIFQPPKELARDELFVKRVIATEGDAYCIAKGVLSINDIEIAEEYICAEIYVDKDYEHTYGTVPTDKVFVMGDNRNNSNDSRRFCCIYTQQIRGKVIMRIWPLNEIRTFVNPFS
ncbi:signal peptidase I [Anaerovirgula multivorans]|uniref:Signal peptidase I n=1 Tax=Anaerovirgula multivorans TaxID=312168 RepID=A0A239H4A9_9FIRM|nr:signal peptidase I [Anaerovirgula multivorans]SNS76249.1 signal peptidase I [Anaerovirgula multivorans]